jgi:hypothetical protein
MDRKRSLVKRGRATITDSTPTTIIPAESGITPALVQLFIHNRNGDLRSIRFDLGQEEWYTFGIGGSGTIIVDMPDQDELARSSGFSAWINDSVGTAANVSVMARYVRFDDRQPVNLNPATYVPQTTRKPNVQGNQ